MPKRDITFDYGEPAPVEQGGRRRRILTFALAASVTVGGLATALYLGTLGYDIRRTNMHEARLRGILVQNPTVYQVTVGLEEKAPLITIVNSDAELEQVLAGVTSDKLDTVREKARSWPQLRVFAAGDMTYFIYFDEDDIMRDYVYLSN